MRGKILGLERRRIWRDEDKLEIVMSVGVGGAWIAKAVYTEGMAIRDSGQTADGSETFQGSGEAGMSTAAPFYHDNKHRRSLFWHAPDNVIRCN